MQRNIIEVSVGRKLDFRERNLLLVNLLDRSTGKIKFSRDLDYGFALTANKAQRKYLF